MLYRTIQKSDTYLPGWLAEKTWCEYIWAINAEQRCERTFIDATLANDLVQNVRACEFKTCEALKQQLPHCAHQTNCLTLISTPDFVPRVQTQAVSQLKCHIENSNKINCDYEPSISLGRALGVHAKVIELLHFAPQLMTSACTTENCHLDWNLTDFTEILKRNIDCPKNLPEHYSIHKNLFSAYTRTSSPHRFRNWGVRMQYFAGWKLFLPSASITQWFSVTWQVQFSLGASRPWATLIHILDSNIFILIHWEIRCLWLKNPFHRWHWNIFDVDDKLYSTYLPRLECIDGHPKEKHKTTIWLYVFLIFFEHHHSPFAFNGRTTPAMLFVHPWRWSARTNLWPRSCDLPDCWAISLGWKNRVAVAMVAIVNQL